jgi:uncharacterized spore protein YtfJ
MMIGDVLNAITERLHSSAHVKTIYGEPIVAEGKTIIPVAEVKYGFGGGGGQQGDASNHGSSLEGEARTGMGGGGGISVRPLGVVEVSNVGTRYIPFENGRKVVVSVLAGVLLGVMVFGRRRRR